jgi:hypothetical protein
MAAIQKRKSVCLITPGHIASNPRLVKEAMALTGAGYKVHIIFTEYVSYLIDHDKRILNQNPEWTYDLLNWTGYNIRSKVSRYISKLDHTLSRNINVKINRNYVWQLTKAVNFKADLYIAHNLAALPVAVNAAKKNNVKCGFDAEDFHRNEESDDFTDPDVILKIAVEEKYIPQLDYMIAASPQITDQYNSLFHRDITTILNVFPKTGFFEIINNTNAPLKLFWFSQTIGEYRGLEAIIEAINISNLPIEFHLLGYSTNQYKKLLTGLLKNPACSLTFHSPVYADELFNITEQFDIGFASETDFSLNRTIALSNKIFTYIQSGLAVMFSNTIAQSFFAKQYPKIGLVYNNPNELAEYLIRYNNERAMLYKTKQAAFKLGQIKLNWEKESGKFIQCVNNVLKKK